MLSFLTKSGRFWAATLALALLVPAAGCGEDVPSLYITSFAQAKPELIVGGPPLELPVTLSQAPTERTYVDVINDDYKLVLLVTYAGQSNKEINIKYNPGERTKTVSIQGIAKGSGKVTFQLRGTAKKQTIGVTVKEVINPDGGPIPDYGTPDQATGDAGSGDATTPDSGSSDATTPDSGTATPDAGASNG